MALTQVTSGGISDGAVTANDLENSGVTAGTYGSSSAIPAITVDAKGRVTSASTNSVTQVGGANGVDFNDNVKARFGTGNDLEIFHDGSNSYIKDVGTGILEIQTNYLQVKNAAADENILQASQNGAVTLYHDNSAKLATTSTGIDVTGTVNCDDLLVADTNAIITLKDTDDSGTNAPVAYVQAQDSNGSRRWFAGDLGNSNPDVYLSNDQSGSLIFRTNASERCFVNSSGHLQPWSNNTYDLGTSTDRWRNVYTNDLNLSNEGGANDVDGTWGSWTIQEGEDDLFLLNRRNGKKYKFNLTEVN